MKNNLNFKPANIPAFRPGLNYLSVFEDSEKYYKSYIDLSPSQAPLLTKHSSLEKVKKKGNQNLFENLRSLDELLNIVPRVNLSYFLSFLLETTHSRRFTEMELQNFERLVQKTLGRNLDRVGEERKEEEKKKEQSNDKKNTCLDFSPVECFCGAVYGSTNLKSGIQNGISSWLSNASDFPLEDLNASPESLSCEEDKLTLQQLSFIFLSKHSSRWRDFSSIVSLTRIYRVNILVFFEPEEGFPKVFHFAENSSNTYLVFGLFRRQFYFNLSDNPPKKEDKRLRTNDLMLSCLPIMEDN